MTEPNPIRTGIIGFGLSGRVFHAPFIAADPRFRLDVISTSDSARRNQATALYPGVDVVGHPDDLLNRAADLDLVVLASPAHTHLSQGLAAFAAGAAVVVDKPFAASVAEAEQLIVASAESEHPLVVFQNRRWDSDFLTVAKLLADGTLGPVHRFESTFERWGPDRGERWRDTTVPSQGAGITFDLGSHLIDQALQLFGPAELEHSELSTLRAGGVSDDEAFLSLRHESGVRSHLMVSRYAAQSAPRFRVLGSESAYTVYGLDGQEPALASGMLPSDDRYGIEPEAKWGLVGVAAEGPLTPVPSVRGDYPAFYTGVADAIQGLGPVPVTAESALETLRIIEQVHTRNAV